MIQFNLIITVASNDEWTNQIDVGKGVLQGDPCSPLLFNLCFNLLMQTLAKPDLQNLGFIWGPEQSISKFSWLQFADDAVIVSSCVKDAQTLLDIFTSWCAWSDMTIRLDKCCSFGMTKNDRTIVQNEPALYINGEKIPTIPPGESFVYLGKTFDFAMNNGVAKTKICEKLNSLLRITSSLHVSSQLKLQIMNRFIRTQLSFELRLYNFGRTWISQNLDSLCYQNIRNWLELPISCCVKEITTLPKSKCGLGIPSFSDDFERLWLKKRHSLQKNTQPEMRLLWKESSHSHVETDSLLLDDNVQTAMTNLKSKQMNQAKDHIFSLSLQGTSVKTVLENIHRTKISLWSEVLNSLPQYMHNFARKALLQQLPTASNLFQWKKIDNPNCCLCKSSEAQSNKHVLSHCAAKISLSRYTSRHDNILNILAAWLKSVKHHDTSLFVDVSSVDYSSIDHVFEPVCRPDLVLVRKSNVYVMELTVCHESNLLKSKLYKTNKYIDIKNHIKPEYAHFNIELFTIEISVLGFISDCRVFCESLGIGNMPKHVLSSIIRSALSSSHNIYCLRNSEEAT